MKIEEDVKEKPEDEFFPKKEIIKISSKYKIRKKN